MRVVFFGSPQIAVPTLARLIAGPHEVVAVVSQPDRRRGRGRKASPTPVAALALEHAIPVLRPEKVGDADIVSALRALEPDVGVVVAFGQFIPKQLRELPSEGYLINAHASLLPKYRGAAPIARAVLAGEAETGISVMRVEKEMDAGDVALVRKLAIGADENTAELSARLGFLAADAIAEALEQIARGELRWSEQDHAQHTLAPKLEADDAVLDWNEGAAALARRVRALAPKPGAVTSYAGEPLRILAARALDAPCDAAPGTLRRAADAPLLRIATGAGWLEVLRLQRSGGKPLAIDAFLRGRDLEDGSVLGG